jgi:hypothetical protein
MKRFDADGVGMHAKQHRQKRQKKKKYAQHLL